VGDKKHHWMTEIVGWQDLIGSGVHRLIASKQLAGKNAP
jgi:hypothetical protein